MLYLIEYIDAQDTVCETEKHDLIAAWDEKEALLNFYTKHIDQYDSHNRELLHKMMRPLNISECVYILNGMLTSAHGGIGITGIYKNLELVYVCGDCEEQNNVQ